MIFSALCITFHNISWQELKKDLAEHQALTESVLHDGENLLKCMSTNSPGKEAIT